MTTNKPEVVAWSWDYRGRHMATTDYSQALELAEPPYPTEVEPLIRLSDYEALQAAHEEELFQLRQTRDAHFGELIRALEQVDALQAECERWKRGSEIRDEQNQDLHSFIMELKAECEKLRTALAESRANDLTAMGYLNQIRQLVGGDDLPDMVERVAKLQAECENLRAAMIEAKSYIDHYMYGGSAYREPAAKAVALIDDALAAHSEQGGGA